MRVLLWSLLVWFAFSAWALADEGVLVREQTGLRGHLCGALRIQLTGTTSVRCEPDGESLPLNERIEAAAARVRSLGARLGVLLERDPDPGRIRMYIVSTRSDQAVIAIESIEDRPEPDVDRSLALKVLDAYEVLRVAATAKPGPPPLAAAIAAPTNDPGSAPATDSAPPKNDPGSISASQMGVDKNRWFMFLDGGGGLSISSRLRGLAALSAGAAISSGRLQLELGAGVRVGSRVREQSSAGQVTVLERGPLLTGRLVWQSGRFGLGAGLDALLLVMAAEGLASDGSRGRQKLLVPALALSLELRMRLFASAHLRLAPALELSAVRQRWAVNDTVLVDQGIARLTLPLSLLVLLPLSGE